MRSTSTHHWLEGTTDACLSLIDAMTKDDKEAMVESAQKLAKYTEIDASPDPYETIKRSAVQLSSGLSDRAKALLEELL